MAKRTKITIETDSLLILRSRNLSRAWCPVCKTEGEVIALANTGAISNLKSTVLQGWLNSGELHSSQADDGSTLICLTSLLTLVRHRNR